jgi:hypothetical protein
MVIPAPQNVRYSYDEENRLLAAGGASFQYDNNGNMLQKAIDGSLTNFTWDYNNMLAGLTTGSTSTRIGMTGF